MSTFGDMITRIADEIGGRPDLTTQIQNAIITAIQHQDDEHFYFNELSATFNTVIGQNSYTPATLWNVSGIASNSWLKINVNGYTYQLDRWNYQELDAADTNANWGAMPYAWSYYNNQIRLYPIPQQVYPITGFFVVKFTPLVDITDTNPWMVDGEEMIRCFAKADLYSNVLLAEANAQQLAQTMVAIGKSAKKSLRSETFKKNTSGFVRNSWMGGRRW